MITSKLTMVIVDASVIGSVSGPGGWAVWIDGETHSGPLPEPMGNNQGELWAVLEGLWRCRHGSQVLLWSDNRQALGWAAGKSSFSPGNQIGIHIREAIKLVVEALDLDIKYQRVKGHAGNREHNIVHELALKEARRAFKEFWS
jgi:ribonuclease HI